MRRIEKIQIHTTMASHRITKWPCSITYWITQMRRSKQPNRHYCRMKWVGWMSPNRRYILQWVTIYLWKKLFKKWTKYKQFGDSEIKNIIEKSNLHDNRWLRNGIKEIRRQEWKKYYTSTFTRSCTYTRTLYKKNITTLLS